MTSLRPSVERHLQKCKEARSVAASVGMKQPYTDLSDDDFEYSQRVCTYIQEKSLMPATREQAASVVASMLGAYAFGLSRDKHELTNKLDKYVDQLDDQPYWAIKKAEKTAIRNFKDREPTPSQFRDECLKHTVDLRWALYDLKKLEKERDNGNATV